MEVSLSGSLYYGKLAPGMREMLDTEQKQLQATEDLYQVLKAQPRYKKIKEPVWTADESPIIVLSWILRRLGPLAQGNPWTIDTWMDGRKERYRFVVYKDFNRNKFQDDWFFVPLDFLPALQKRDAQMHDLIIDVIALVNRSNGVPLWDEDGDFSEQLSDFVRTPPSSIQALDRQRQNYISGPAHDYLHLVRRRVGSATIEGVKKQLAQYQATSQRKRCLIYWLEDGLDLARTRRNLRPFNYQPEYTKADGAVGAHRYYKFVWSYHENDYVKTRTMQQMRAEDGSYPPVMFSVARPGQKLKPIVESDFPIKLYEFMSYGWKHFLGGFKEYYYKKQLEEVRTPAEVMLENIENAEIRKLAKVRV